MPRRPRIPEPEPPETDPELEQIIAELIERKYAASKGSAAYLLAKRALAGLRYTRELVGPIMEDLGSAGVGRYVPESPCARSRRKGAATAAPATQAMSLC